MSSKKPVPTSGTNSSTSATTTQQQQQQPVYKQLSQQHGRLNARNPYVGFFKHAPRGYEAFADRVVRYTILFELFEFVILFF